jgi:hypothetical protein
MFPTVEVRWFQQGQVDPDVQAWFHRVAEHAEEQSPRTDYYLQEANAGGIGIKLREGLVEIKERRHFYGRVEFHPHVRGIVDGWRKWSFPYPEDIDLGDSAAFDQSWIGVEKARWLALFQVEDDGVEAAPGSTEPSFGCGLELTRVEARESIWWSVGLEAFGAKDQNYERLITTADHIFSTADPPRFQADHSYAYTKWLDLIQV